MDSEDRRGQMERLLALREREGLSFREAARRGGVARGTLAWWSKRLQQEETQSKAPGFAEVTVVEDGSCPWSGIEIVVAGHLVRVSRGFDGATLRRVLEALTC